MLDKYKLKIFMVKLEAQQIEHLKKLGYDCQANISNCKVTLKEGRVYYKVNVGNSGKFMLDMEGNIFGIKGYGVINKKKRYGTLDTTYLYDWGGYHPTAIPVVKKV